MNVNDELARELAVIRSTEDIVPYMTKWLSVGEAEFRPLPNDMLAIIRSSPDYREISAGAPPTRLQLAAENDHAELVIYRAIGDRRHYVLVPSKRSLPAVD